MSCALSRQETAGAAGDTAKSWMENSEPLQLAGKGRAFFKKKYLWASNWASGQRCLSPRLLTSVQSPGPTQYREPTPTSCPLAFPVECLLSMLAIPAVAEEGKEENILRFGAQDGDSSMGTVLV